MPGSWLCSDRLLFILWSLVTASTAVTDKNQPAVEVTEIAEERMQKDATNSWETERATYKRMLHELQEKLLSYEQKLRLPSQKVHAPLASEEREEVIALI